MIDKRRGSDRRSERRYPAAGKIFWQTAGKRDRKTGWLSDRSASSVSFITAAGIGVQPGETIDLIDATNVTQQCQVARTEPYDERLSLIACRRLRASPQESLGMQTS
jgi:hypothetical protein